MNTDLLTNNTNSFYQESFVGLTMTGEWIRSKEFEDCRFEQCRFTDCTFFECAFLECQFSNCLLSGVKVPGCSLVAVQFSDCKLVGVNWTEASNFRGIVFTKCGLDFVVFHGIKHKGLKMLDCVCKEADFQEADLTDSSFENTDFEKSIFQHTNLTNANFTGARNYWIDPRNNVLKKARFSMPEAISLLKPFDVVIDTKR